MTELTAESVVYYSLKTPAAMGADLTEYMANATGQDYFDARADWELIRQRIQFLAEND